MTQTELRRKPVFTDGTYLLVDDVNWFRGGKAKWVHFVQVQRDSEVLDAHREEAGTAYSFPSMKPHRTPPRNVPDTVSIGSTHYPLRWMRVLPEGVQEQLKRFDEEAREIQRKKNEFMAAVAKSGEYYEWDNPDRRSFPFFYSHVGQKVSCNRCGQDVPKGTYATDHIKVCPGRRAT